MSLILQKFEDEIAILTLNNDARRNCLNQQLLEELITALRYYTEKRARVLIIRANPGARVWSAGFDVGNYPNRDATHFLITTLWNKQFEKCNCFPLR